MDLPWGQADPLPARHPSHSAGHPSHSHPSPSLPPGGVNGGTVTGRVTPSGIGVFIKGGRIRRGERGGRGGDGEKQQDSVSGRRVSMSRYEPLNDTHSSHPWLNHSLRTPVLPDSSSSGPLAHSPPVTLSQRSLPNQQGKKIRGNRLKESVSIIPVPPRPADYGYRHLFISHLIFILLLLGVTHSAIKSNVGKIYRLGPTDLERMSETAGFHWGDLHCGDVPVSSPGYWYDSPFPHDSTQDEIKKNCKSNSAGGDGHEEPDSEGGGCRVEGGTPTVSECGSLGVDEECGVMANDNMAEEPRRVASHLHRLSYFQLGKRSTAAFRRPGLIVCRESSPREIWRSVRQQWGRRKRAPSVMERASSWLSGVNVWELVSRLFVEPPRAVPLEGMERGEVRYHHHHHHGQEGEESVGWVSTIRKLVGRLIRRRLKLSVEEADRLVVDVSRITGASVATSEWGGLMSVSTAGTSDSDECKRGEPGEVERQDAPRESKHSWAIGGIGRLKSDELRGDFGVSDGGDGSQPSERCSRCERIPVKVPDFSDLGCGVVSLSFSRSHSYKHDNHPHKCTTTDCTSSAGMSTPPRLKSAVSLTRSTIDSLRCPVPWPSSICGSENTPTSTQSTSSACSSSPTPALSLFSSRLSLSPSPSAPTCTNVPRLEKASSETDGTGTLSSRFTSLETDDEAPPRWKTDLLSDLFTSSYGVVSPCYPAKSMVYSTLVGGSGWRLWMLVFLLWAHSFASPQPVVLIHVRRLIFYCAIGFYRWAVLYGGLNVFERFVLGQSSPSILDFSDHFVVYVMILLIVATEFVYVSRSQQQTRALTGGNGSHHSPQGIGMGSSTGTVGRGGGTPHYVRGRSTEPKREPSGNTGSGLRRRRDFESVPPPNGNEDGAELSSRTQGVATHNCRSLSLGRSTQADDEVDTTGAIETVEMRAGETERTDKTTSSSALSCSNGIKATSVTDNSSSSSSGAAIAPLINSDPSAPSDPSVPLSKSGASPLSTSASLPSLNSPPPPSLPPPSTPPRKIAPISSRSRCSCASVSRAILVVIVRLALLLVALSVFYSAYFTALYFHSPMETVIGIVIGVVGLHGLFWVGLGCGMIAPGDIGMVRC
eukprot:GHVN01076904.1.p1 GENE.GHVN01076904.1~~GHVN01076904.1.p1  ORF type:complete len:1105 (-),score=262.84 GHVN01076904.1:216-3530(-)